MKRLKEPSTWAGLALIAQGVGAFFGIDGTLLAGIIGGLGAVFLKEKAGA